MQTVAIVIATCGDYTWADLARRRALPSALAQRPDQLVLHHEKAATVCQSRNNAAHAATTDWLIFLDADDELGPGYLKSLDLYLDKPRLLLAPYVQYVLKSRVTRPHIPNAGNWPNGNDAVTGTAISTHLFSKIGGWDHHYWPWSDWELWLRATKAGARRIHIPDAVYIAHDNPNSENHKLQDPQALHAKVKRQHSEVWDEVATAAANP